MKHMLAWLCTFACVAITAVLLYAIVQADIYGNDDARPAVLPLIILSIEIDVITTALWRHIRRHER